MHTGSDLIEAEVLAIKSRDLIEIEVRQHINNEFIGESFYVEPAYFELAEGDKQFPPITFFQEVEDIKAVYFVIANESAKLGMSLYNLYCDSLLNPKDAVVQYRIQSLMAERARYEKILLRLADYIEVRKHDKRIMPNDGRENKTD